MIAAIKHYACLSQRAHSGHRATDRADVPGVTQSDEAAGPLQVVEPVCLPEGLNIIDGAFSPDHIY